MQLPIVDRNDVEIATKERDELAPTDIYRVSALWIVNSRGDILIAQRALTKKKGPGQWGPAAAGTVEVGETYETNIMKEAEEELGVSPSVEDLQAGSKVFIERPDGAYFCQWYFACLDKELAEFVYEPLEVMALAWTSEEKLREAVAARPDDFTPTFQLFLDRLLSESRRIVK